MNDIAIQERPPSTDLVDLKVLTPAAVFSAEGGVDAIIKAITEKVRAFKGDMSTALGRKEIASFAHKVSRSKTLLDGWGKALGQNHYDSWKAITAERGRIEDALDALRDEVRKPLDDWEQADQDRVGAHEGALACLIALGEYRTELNVADIDTRLAQLTAAFARDWQEFTVRATEAEAAARKGFLSLREATVKRNAERAELARLQQEQAAREQKEREDKIAADAAERARVEAETRAAREAAETAAKAERERQRIAQEAVDAIARAEKAEADKKAAAEKAERDRQAAAEAAERARVAAEEKADRDRVAAIEAERKRIADAKAAEDAATAKREANLKHVAKINKAAADALVECAGLEPKVAHIVIAAIARGEIPHVSIAY